MDKDEAKDRITTLIFMFAGIVSITLGALYYWHRDIESYFAKPDLAIALLMIPLVFISIVLFFYLLLLAVRIENDKIIVRRVGKRKGPKMEKGAGGKL